MPNIQNHAMEIGHLSLEEHPFDELDALRGLDVQERKFIRRMLRSLFATGANEVVEIIMKGLTRRNEPER